MGKLYCHPKTSIYAGCDFVTRCTNPAGSTTAITLPELNGFGDDYFNNHYYMQVLKNSNSAGNAPEHQVRKITDYVSATGVFTTDAFTANVESGDEVIILHESLVAIGRDDSNNVFDSSSVTANEDGSILERLQWVQDTLGGAAIQLRVERSGSGTVEENQYMEFSIGLMDVDSGAITSANINITAISVEMARSRSGGAFSAVGITQPTFSKGDGRVYCEYQFLAAEWQIGDVYRLKVSGITCTVGGDTAYVPMQVWSNMVMEGEDIDTNVETILAGQQGAGIASFPAAANPGNNINLAQVMRAVITSMVGGDDYDGYTNINNSANVSIDAIAQKFATIFAANGTNVFNPTIGGSARTDMELALNALATYFSASAAAWSVAMNNTAANTDLEATIEAYLTWIGIDGTNTLTAINNVSATSLNTALQTFAGLFAANGTNVFNPTIGGSARTDMDAALNALAAYFSASAAAWSITMNNGAATTDLEATLEAVLTWVGINGTNTLTAINNTASATLDAALQNVATVLGANSTNVFNPTIQGSARTDLDTAMQTLASYFSGSSAAWALQTNNQTARTNLEQTIGDINAAIGIDGANAWSTSIAGATQTTVEGSVQIIGSSVDHLYALADGGTNAYPDSVVQESIFAYIMSKSADPVVTSYNNTTDSLEAISDAISSGSYSVVADSGTSTTVVDATYAQANDYFNGCLLVCISGTNAGQARPVVDFVSASGTFTVFPAFNGAVVASDAFVLISGWKFAEWIVMPDVPVTDTATTTESDCVIFDLSTAGNSYRVNSLRLKFADPGANTVTVNLSELINDVLTVVDSFTVTTANYGTYFSLMDMFGTMHLSGDNLKVSCVMDAGTVAVTGQYSYEKAYSA